ncbi:MAG: hypothetical protein ACOC2D_04940 [Spirochaetota bacterium]
MKNVVALFSDASDAEKAVQKLEEAGIGTQKASIHSRQTIESSANVRAMPSANAGIAGGVSAPGAPAGAGSAGGAFVSDDTIESYLMHIGVDGEEVAFFQHGIKEGGHLVLAAVEDSEADTARDALVEAGGSVPQVE